MKTFTRLTDRRWQILEPILTEERTSRLGRPRLHGDRAALEGVLWVLRTRARWRDLPDGCPSYSTCCRRFRRWADSGILKKLFAALARGLEADGRLDLSECHMDGTFVPARKGEFYAKNVIFASTH